MKKLFIGCGVLVLLGMGALGYCLYTLYPDLKQWQAAGEQFATTMQQLDESHVFDPAAGALDEERFVEVLELRSEFRRDVAERLRLFSDTMEGQDGDEPGLFEQVRQMLRALEDVTSLVAESLAMSGMGPTEFSYYCRLLWAALQTVDGGMVDSRLADLNGEYSTLRGAYSEARRQQDSLPPLDEIIGVFNPELVARARMLLTRDPGLVKSGITDAWVEARIYMNLQSVRLDNLVAGEAAGPGGPARIDSLAEPTEDP